MGGTLTVHKQWHDDNANAYASKTGLSWEVFMLGGLARHAAITKDGFALVVCHEIGHLIGGAPLIPGRPEPIANEGQADYWGATKCLKRYLRSGVHNVAVNGGFETGVNGRIPSNWKRYGTYGNT